MDSLLCKLYSIKSIKQGDFLVYTNPFLQYIIKVNWVHADSFGYSLYGEHTGGVMTDKDIMDTFYTIHLLTIEYNPRTMVRKEYKSGR